MTKHQLKIFETLILHLEPAKTNCFACTEFNGDVTVCVPVNLHSDGV